MFQSLFSFKNNFILKKRNKGRELKVFFWFFFHEKNSTEGCFSDKIPAAICWCNEMASAGRRSEWPPLPLLSHCSAVESRLSAADGHQRPHHHQNLICCDHKSHAVLDYGGFAKTECSICCHSAGTKTGGKLIKAAALCSRLSTCKHHNKYDPTPQLLGFWEK